jgi:adenylate cyclase
MTAAFDRMLGGQAQVVTLLGEAGVGKSRLLDEVLAALERDGRLRATAVRRASCSSLGDSPYAILAAFFRDAYGVGPAEPLASAREKLAAGLAELGAGPDEATAIAPLLGYLLGLTSGEGFHHVEPEQLRRQIRLAVRRLVERRLQQGPLVLVVENLQWADAASLDLLRSLMDRLADRPLMLVATCRPSTDAAALATERAASTTLRLATLSTRDSERLLSAYFGSTPTRLPPRFRDRVLSRAGGHPLFLEEIVRSLVAAGTLVRSEDGWTVTAAAGAADVPVTIQGLLLARVDGLVPGARRLLREAAVLGATFDTDVLRQMATDRESTDASLAVLERSGLVERLPGLAGASPVGHGGPTHRFAQALLHDVAYQSLLVSRRTELHGRAGRILEARAAGAPERLEELEALGRHFSLGGEPARGARYLLRAGNWARDLYANDDAVRLYERALDALPRDDADGIRWDVREQLADLLGPMGHRDAALSHYEAVLTAAEPAGDRAVQARLHRKIGGLIWEGGERPAALARLEAGLALMEGFTEHVELAYLHQEMGRLLFRSGDNRGAIEWAERARVDAERLTEPAAADPSLRKQVAAVGAQAENTLGVALARTGRLREAVGHIERSVALAEANELLRAACRGYTNLGVLYSNLDPKRAIETCLRGIETATRIGDLGFQSRLKTNLAVAYCALTNRCEEQGLDAAQTALDLDRQLGQLDHLAVPLIVLGQIQQCHGDPEKALGYYREALEIAEQTGEPQTLFPCYDGLATIYLDRGDEAKAEEFMAKAQGVCEQAGLEPEAFMVLPFLE